MKRLGQKDLLGQMFVVDGCELTQLLDHFLGD